MAHALQPLAGAHIVVTRPLGRGDGLAARIRAAGGEALLFPVINIAALSPVLPDAHPDWLIFASVAAVEHGLAAVRPRMHAATRVAAIGAATANALREAGVRVDVVPERQESEGLLEAQALADAGGQAVWIVRGRGGRGLLAAALAGRGARVHFIEAYERRVPATDAQPLLDRWRAGRLDAIVVTSRDGLLNLNAMLGSEGRGHLHETQLVMPTERMLKLALELDIRPAPAIAANASDDAMLAALAGWWRGRLQDPR